MDTPRVGPDPVALPEPESARLQAVARYDAAGSGADLRALVQMMGEACGAPMAAMTLIGRDEVECRAGWRVPEAALPRGAALCPAVLEAGRTVVVPDLTTDPRFAQNPMVTGGPRLRFYAGVPLHSEGYTVGTLCVYDTIPHSADDRMVRTLETLAGWVDAEAAARHTLATAAPAPAEVESLRTEILATVSHEVRTPVTAIQGYLEVIADELGYADRMPHVEAIERNIARLCRTVDQLLIAACGNTASLAPRLAGVDLAQIATSAVAQQGAEPGRFELLLPTRPAIVEADTDLLVRALGNLLANAVLFGAADARVCVAVTSDPVPSVRITDHGHGIPVEELGRVREPFFRGARARAEHLPGLGLGLTVAAQIVEAHEGRLGLDSTLGAGTTVTVTFPPHRENLASCTRESHVL